VNTLHRRPAEDVIGSRTVTSSGLRQRVIIHHRPLAIDCGN